VATFASQLISFGVLLVMFFSGKSIVRLKIRSISRRFAVYRDVTVTGFPSFCRQILASLCTVLLNWAVKPYDGALAALGVVQKVFMLAFSISLGIGQGYQPVLGYNYSAKRFDRVKKAYLFTLTFAVSVMLVFGSVCAIFADGVMRMFSLSKDATSIGTLTLRLQCMCMPLLPVNFMISITYQTVGNKAIASVLSVARQGLFYIPAVMILPRFFALLGVQACQSVSDVLSFLFSIPFTVIFLRSVERQRKEMGEGGNEAITSVTIDESDYMME
jgi:Na+-driven multidrug efflux pump